ncbi:MAG: hypothetical protein F4X95_03340 [Oligoflexia bacterium]|nr:hypothetical protein [Oligoflexia bacterium]
MAKRVGITTDLYERKSYWQNQYPSLHNWTVVSRGLTYEQAQQKEEYYEMLGYIRGAGGQYVSGYVWSIYTFEY